MLLKFPLLLVGRCVSWYVPKIGSITDESEKLTGFTLFCRENRKAGSRVIFDFINNGNPLELSPDYFVAPNLPQEIAKFNSSRGNLNLSVGYEARNYRSYRLSSLFARAYQAPEENRAVRPTS